MYDESERRARKRKERVVSWYHSLLSLDGTYPSKKVGVGTQGGAFLTPHLKA